MSEDPDDYLLFRCVMQILDLALLDSEAIYLSSPPALAASAIIVALGLAFEAFPLDCRGSLFDEYLCKFESEFAHMMASFCHCYLRLEI